MIVNIRKCLKVFIMIGSILSIKYQLFLSILFSLLLSSCVLVDFPIIEMDNYEIKGDSCLTDSLRVDISYTHRILFDWRMRKYFLLSQLCSSTDSAMLHRDSITIHVNGKKHEIRHLYDKNWQSSDSFPFNHPDGISISFGGRIKEGDSVTIIEKGVPEPSKQFTIQFIVPIDTITKKKRISHE